MLFQVCYSILNNYLYHSLNVKQQISIGATTFDRTIVLRPVRRALPSDREPGLTGIARKTREPAAGRARLGERSLSAGIAPFAANRRLSCHWNGVARLPNRVFTDT